MTEHHPDIELIMALAGGELPPEEAARIEAELDPEARAELAAQRAVPAALGELRRPVMTLDESRRLRSAVRKELDLDRGRAYATLPGRRERWPTFARALPALAVAASLVAVIAIAVNLADRPMADEAEPTAAATRASQTTAAAAAPATTAASALTTTTVAPAETTSAPAEESMAGDAMAYGEVQAEEEMSVEAAAALDEASAALAEPEFAYAPATTTVAATAPVTTVGVTDTTESFAAEAAAFRVDYAFAFSTDRADDALLFTAAVIAERGDEAFSVVQLADRAPAKGLVCWEYAADAADPGDEVSFMGYGLIDGEEGEAYRIDSPQQDDDPVIHLFAYPDCRPVDFLAG